MDSNRMWARMLLIYSSIVTWLHQDDNAVNISQKWEDVTEKARSRFIQTIIIFISADKLLVLTGLLKQM